MLHELFLAKESFGYGLVHIKVNGDLWTNSFVTYEAAIDTLATLGCVGAEDAEDFRTRIFLFPDGHTFKAQCDFREQALREAGFTKVEDTAPQ